jgi:hypothetical protein
MGNYLLLGRNLKQKISLLSQMLEYVGKNRQKRAFVERGFYLKQGGKLWLIQNLKCLHRTAGREFSRQDADRPDLHVLPAAAVDQTSILSLLT